MTCTLKLQNNIRNGSPILDNPTKVLSFMFRTLLVLKLLKCPTPDGGHLGYVQYGRHRGSPSCLPREIGRRWLYVPLVQKWCLWNDLNNYLIKPPDYVYTCIDRKINLDQFPWESKLIQKPIKRYWMFLLKTKTTHQPVYRHSNNTCGESTLHHYQLILRIHPERVLLVKMYKLNDGI